jgi:hypothetical protein
MQLAGVLVLHMCPRLLASLHNTSAHSAASSTTPPHQERGHPRPHPLAQGAHTHRGAP